MTCASLLLRALSRVGITAERSAYTRHFIGSDAHADACAAHQDSAFRLTIGDRYRYALSNVRIIHWISRM
jgi:hypothetical protein